MNQNHGFDTATITAFFEQLNTLSQEQVQALEGGWDAVWKAAQKEAKIAAQQAAKDAAWNVVLQMANKAVIDREGMTRCAHCKMPFKPREAKNIFCSKVECKREQARLQKQQQRKNQVSA